MILRLIGLMLALLTLSTSGLASSGPESVSDKSASTAADRDRLNATVQPTGLQGELPSMAAINFRNARLERVVDGLTLPRSMAFIDDTQLLINELGGRMLRYDLAEKKLTPIDHVPSVITASEQTGLLDIAVHPRFADNQWVYFSYVVGDPESGRYYLTAVDRARLVNDALADRERLLTAEPYLWSPSNFGGALAFGPDDILFITIGDRSEASFAQDGERLEGKILRLKDDGSVPDDNPFVGDDGIDDRIYALGVRNPQGLHFDKVSGLLFEAEHGPMGGDEVNLIRAGRNYGWPEVTYGQNYTGESIGHGTHQSGMEQPLFYYLPSEAMSPLVVYRGRMFPEWNGDLLVGALKGKHVSHLDLDGTVVRSEYPLLREIDGRIRDLAVASDGSVFILSQTGSLYRLVRDPTHAPKLDTAPAAFDAATVYQFVCAGCHESGAYHAPRPSVHEEWAKVKAKPREEVYRHVIEGFGAMPKRGLCNLCTDEHLRLTTDFLLDTASKPK